MPVFDIFSKRQKRLRGDLPDVYQYRDFPRPFRNQVIHILKDTLGVYSYDGSPTTQAFASIQSLLCREYGRFRLTPNPEMMSPMADVFSFIQTCDEPDNLVDIIEVSFRYIDNLRDSDFYRIVNGPMGPDEAIQELNQRFLEHGIGYQYESGLIIRIDSKMVHAEVVKPTLSVLNEKMYSGANEEYLTAHEHYRNGRHKECLIYCLKAFESVMKAICTKHKWVYGEGDTAKRLLDICFEKGLFPTYLQNQFSSLRGSLESGIPTVRNRLAGHGQGAEQVDVPPFIASYLLHLTATSILFLADAEKELSRRK